MKDSKFEVGDWVRMAYTDYSLIAAGSEGEVVAYDTTGVRIMKDSKFEVGDWVREDGTGLYVKFKPQIGVDAGCSIFWTLNNPFVSGLWLCASNWLELISGGMVDKYAPGENGWIPDQIAEGIDVMAITEELVSMEVGK